MSRNTSVSTTRLPVAASNARALSEMPRLSRGDSPASTDVVTQTLPPPTTGEDHPRPSTGTFQRTFSSSLQRSGTSCASAWPCPVGPRNCGHCCPASVCAKSSSRTADGPITRITVSRRAAVPLDARHSKNTRRDAQNALLHLCPWDLYAVSDVFIAGPATRKDALPLSPRSSR